MGGPRTLFIAEGDLDAFRRPLPCPAPLSNWCISSHPSMALGVQEWAILDLTQASLTSLRFAAQPSNHFRGVQELLRSGSISFLPRFAAKASLWPSPPAQIVPGHPMPFPRNELHQLHFTVSTWEKLKNYLDVAGIGQAPNGSPSGEENEWPQKNTAEASKSK